MLTSTAKLTAREHRAGLFKMAQTVIAVAVLLFCLFGVPAAAQEDDDRGFVANLLETLLSRQDSDVVIEGLSGVARGPVEILRVSVSDHLGEWLEIEDLQIDWDRARLLRGEVVFRTLRAEQVTLRRKPVPTEDEFPSAAAGGFKLPELPVSFQISKLAFPQISISEEGFAEPAEIKIQGAADLAANKGSFDLKLARIDDRTDSVAMDLSYDGTSDFLLFRAGIQEAPGGVVSRLLELPGAPAINLAIDGSGTFEDFNATLDLLTNDVERLAGELRWEGDAEGATDFRLDLGGDARALLKPDYREMFGEKSEIRIVGTRHPDEGVDLSDLSITTDELTVSGSAVIGADKIPTSFHLVGIVESLNETPVLLPFPGPQTRVGSAHLVAEFDAAASDNWFLRGNLHEFEREGVALELFDFRSNGQISDSPEGESATLEAIVGLTGLELPPQDNVARALGTNSQTRLSLAWESGSPGIVADVAFSGDHLTVDFGGELLAIDRSLSVSGDSALFLNDLGLFDWPEPFALDGQATLSFDGDIDVLGGEFDAEFEGDLRELTTGRPNADKLLGADLTVKTAIRRDTDGTEIDGLSVLASNLAITADGRIGDGRGEGSFDATIPQLSDVIPAASGLERNRVLPSLDGSLDVRGRFLEQPDAAWETSIEADGPAGMSAAIKGVLRENASRLAIGARVPVFPDLPAPLNSGISIDGTATQVQDVWSVDALSVGPGPIRSRMGAQLSDGTLSAPITIDGQIPLRILDPVLAPNEVVGTADFHVSMGDVLSDPNLAGGLVIKGATVSIFDISETLVGVDLEARLAEGSISVDGTARGQSGGRLRVTGATGVRDGLPMDLTAEIHNYTLRRPDILSTRLDGSLNLTGDLVGQKSLRGNLTIGETLVQIVPNGFPSVSPVPSLKHINESPRVRLTRERAGVPDARDRGGNGPPIALDLKVTAPGTVRVIGPSLAATLGGSVQITGTTDDIKPEGKIGLVDGQVGLIGHRLDLTSGNIWLKGSLMPWVELVARGESRDITLQTIISGPANDVNIDVVSRPSGRFLLDNATRPSQRSRLGFPSGQVLTEDEAVSTFFLGNPGNSVSPLQVVRMLYGAHSLSQTKAMSLKKALTSNFEENHATPASGLAPVSAPRPLERDVLLRVQSDVDGDSEVVLEIEISNDLSVIGRTESGGNSSIGFSFTRDY